MDAFGYVLFGVVLGISTVMTHYLLKWSKKYMEMKITAYIDRHPEFQEKLRDRYGWK